MNSDISKAAALLQQDELVVIPTETVYGLAANAFSETAVQKIYELKGRPKVNPLIVHIKDASYLETVATQIPKEAFLLAEKFWPGPLTMVLQKKDCISDIVSANKNTVGVRVPQHKTCLALLSELEFPLVAPSANKSNHISPTQPKHVQSSLGDLCPFILEGGTAQMGLESTILGFVDGKIFIYRHGVILKETLSAFLGVEIYEKTQSELPESPGMFLKHYAPHTPLFLSDHAISLANGPQKIAYLRFKDIHEKAAIEDQFFLSKEGLLKEAAAQLYAQLHRIDTMGYDAIVAELVPNEGIGVAINDKLQRAAH